MKNMFDSPIFQKITRLADFFIASLLWLITSLPVITIVPATIAMYYTTAKIVKYEVSESTVKNFFHAFKVNLKQGTWLSVLYILAAVILYTFIDVARAVGFETLYSKIYIVLTLVYTLGLAAITLCLIPIVSRFNISTLSAIKLSIQFVFCKPIKIVSYVIALVGVIGICYMIPPMILVMPAGFCFSLCSYTEPLLIEYMEEKADETMDQPEWLYPNEQQMERDEDNKDPEE